MFWIALCPSHEDERTAWGWHALQFTPRVALLDEAVVLEAAASERLWGGRKALVQALVQGHAAVGPCTWATGPTAFVALARLRLNARGAALPRKADAFPLDVLTAAREHLPTLERMGCRTWGQLRALPRGGVARRFGDALLHALDCAYGDAPQALDWLTLPEHFDLKVELPALACAAPELMWTAQRLLSHLQLWLQARNRGVVALELEWTIDLRRLDGKPLPPHEGIVVRTAEPTQDMAHLRRLAGEHLARARLSGPASHLRIRSLETVPWGGRTASLLPQDARSGDRLHELIERLSARLGADQVVQLKPCPDHRPEKMQSWVPASQAQPSMQGVAADALFPTWLLPQPQPLEVRNNVPQYRGPLRRLTRLFRVETAWWEEAGPALRDYFVASSPEAGLVWIYRERPLHYGAASRWYLQGLYA